MAEDNTAGKKLHSLTRNLPSYLEEPVSAASLAVFRICFSISCIALVVEYFREGWIAVLSAKFHFSFLPGIVPLPGPGLYVHLIMVGVFAFMVGIGFYYRFASIALFLSYSWLFLCEKSLYQNHTYLICLLSLLFSFVNAHHCYSLDRKRLGVDPFVPRWHVDIFKFQFLVVYFYGGLAKLNSDWLHGRPQTEWILQRAANPTVGPILGPIFSTIFRQGWFPILVTYGGIVIDLTIGFLLWWRPTFWLATLIVCVFHLLNFALFNIDVFPFLMISTIGMFASEDWPERLIRRFRANRSQVENEVFTTKLQVSKTRTSIALFICAYIAIQLLFPLRKLFYPGDTSWTEQGQRFAWRMMLRDKKCRGFKMIFVNPSGGMNGVVEPQYSLSARQIENMEVIPDMILQYAHAVAGTLESELGFRPIVRAQSIVSLNGRPAQNLIDRTVDLASTPTSFMPANWIVPLHELKEPAGK